ncbi:uncharacterized protein LOC132384373 [Hypanus sabinus]|uniref:uncharacterized protein LOC132384373 n=1 Tax=Hypanus sabinus TaxID=79690 RepID=UPI0028C48FA0|nr:uncharacterized protein LOC132384373 [Hypanus sabinus]
MEQLEVSSTEGSTQEPSTVPNREPSLDSHPDTTWEPHGSASSELGPVLSTTPGGSISSGPYSQSDTTREPQDSVTAEPARDVPSDTTWEPQGLATGEPGLVLFSTQGGPLSSDSDSFSDRTREPQGSVTGELSPGVNTTARGSASSGLTVSHVSVALSQTWRVPQWNSLKNILLENRPKNCPLSQQETDPQNPCQTQLGNPRDRQAESPVQFCSPPKEDL